MAGVFSLFETSKLIFFTGELILRSSREEPNILEGVDDRTDIAWSEDGCCG